MITIKERLTDFPVPAYINQRTDSEDITIGQVHNWDEVEHCIIQALAENDASYYLHIGDMDIKLIDEEIFTKIDQKYPQCTSYPLYSYNTVRLLREKNAGKEDKYRDEMIQKYTGYYGEIGYGC